MRFEKKTFRDETVILDNNDYVDCTFVNCRFSYGGGAFFLDDIKIEGTFGVVLTAEAFNTLAFMQTLGCRPDLRQYVVDLLDPRNVCVAARPRERDAPKLRAVSSVSRLGQTH